MSMAINTSTDVPTPSTALETLWYNEAIWTGLWLNFWTPLFILVLVTFWKNELSTCIKSVLRPATNSVAVATVKEKSSDFLHLYKTELQANHWKTETGASFLELEPHHSGDESKVLHVCRDEDAGLWRDLSGNGRTFKEAEDGLEGSPRSLSSLLQRSYTSQLPAHAMARFEDVYSTEYRSQQSMQPQTHSNVPSGRVTPPPPYESSEGNETFHLGSGNPAQLPTQTKPVTKVSDKHHLQVELQNQEHSPLCSQPVNIDDGEKRSRAGQQKLLEMYSEEKGNNTERNGITAEESQKVHRDAEQTLSTLDIHSISRFNATERPEDAESAGKSGGRQEEAQTSELGQKPEIRTSSMLLDNSPSPLTTGNQSNDAFSHQHDIDQPEGDGSKTTDSTQKDADVSGRGGDMHTQSSNSFFEPNPLQTSSPCVTSDLNPDQRAASYHPIILDDIAMMEDSEDYYSNSGVFDALVLKIESFCVEKGVRNFQYLQDPGCATKLFVFGKNITKLNNELNELAANQGCADFRVFTRDREEGEEIFSPLVNVCEAGDLADNYEQLKPPSEREFTFLTWKNIKGRKRIVEYSRCEMLVYAEDKNRNGVASEPDIWALLTGHHILDVQQQRFLQNVDSQHRYNQTWDSMCAPSKEVSFGLLTHDGHVIDVCGPPIWRFWRNLSESESESEGFGDHPFDKFYNDILCIRLDNAQLKKFGLLDENSETGIMRTELKTSPSALSLSNLERHSFKDKGIFPLTTPVDMRKFLPRSRDGKKVSVRVAVDGKLGKIGIGNVKSTSEGYKRGLHFALTLDNGKVLPEGTSGAIIHTIDRQDKQGIATGMLVSIFKDPDLSCGATYEGVVLWPALRQLEHYHNDRIGTIRPVGGDEFSEKQCTDVFDSLSHDNDSGISEG